MPVKRSAHFLLVMTCAALIPVCLAADWPQWRGPRRTGISEEKEWTWKWPRGGPRRLWTARVGDGYSAVSVQGKRAYTMGNARGKDTVYCFNAETGKTFWTYSYPSPPRGYMADPKPGGTAATPTIDGSNVYVLSREGLALCLNAASGKLVWQQDLQKETRAQLPSWGFAGSPLVDGERAIYNVGEAGVALGKTSGKLIWKSATGVAGYATPVPYAVGNQRGIALFTGTGLLGVDPATGRILWQHPWDTRSQVNAADPIFSGDSVFISSNYDKGCALVRLGGGKPTVVWQNRNMRNHFNSCVLVNGYLYGNDQDRLKCLDWKTGEAKWQQRGLGKGGLMAAGDHLIVLTEQGMLIVAKATPNRYAEVATAPVIGGMNWTHPVLANGRLYCRSREGELACLDVSGRK